MGWHGAYKPRKFEAGELILALRTRTKLTQAELAELIGVSRRTVQSWESGAGYPHEDKLRQLISVFLTHDALTPGQEYEEAIGLWQQVDQDAPRRIARFDEVWFARTLALASPSVTLPESIRQGGLSQGRQEQRREHDWREMPTLPEFFGRTAELAQLHQWLVVDHYRLVTILGIGGQGKTTLAAQLVPTIAAHFDLVIWRSLINAPPLKELLATIWPALSGQQVSMLADTLDQQLELFFAHLQQQRVLLVLDNLESILQADAAGSYRSGYEPYDQLLQGMITHLHQGQLLLTSRERPQKVQRWERDKQSVRTLRLSGLDEVASQHLLTSRGVSGLSADEVALSNRYSGNPLALKLVADTVQEFFGGDIGVFLNIEAPVFDDIRTVLDQQFARLTPLEQELLLWLAIERTPVTADMLRNNLIQPPSMARFLDALHALQRRSLVENAGTNFLLQNVVMEYGTEQLIERVCGEIAGDRVTHDMATNQQAITLSWLNRHALSKAEAAEYLRKSQVRLILQPVAARLLQQWGEAGLLAKIAGLLAMVRETAPLTPGYLAGNLLILLIELGVDISGFDFSNLCVWQAYLRDAYLPRLNLAGADLTGAAFAYRFGTVQGLEFRSDGELLVMGFSEGLLGLWRARTGELLQHLPLNPHTFHSAYLRSDCQLIALLTTQQTLELIDVTSNTIVHTLTVDPSPIWRISFSPNGQYVASGHFGGHICVWEIASGRLCARWQAHAAPVTGLAFAPDGGQITSGAVDGSAALWQTTTATRIHSLHGHTDEVSVICVSPDGATLITGSHDHTVRLWLATSGAALDVLNGHTNLVRKAVIAPNGRWLVTGGVDSFLYLWDLQTGKDQQLVADRPVEIRRVTFSHDNQFVAAYDLNETISVWEVASGQRLDSYRLHNAGILALAISPDGHWLISGGVDSALYLWDISQPEQAQWTARLVGHRHSGNALAFSSDGELIASADISGGLRLWSPPKGASRNWVSRELTVAQKWIKKIDFSADGQTLAIPNEEGLHLWSMAAGRQTQLLHGSTQAARVCIFSPDGRWLASGHLDHAICLWALDERGGIVLHCTLRHHTNLLQALLFSADSRALFSSSYDNTLARWDVATATLQASWSTGRDVYQALAFQPDGRQIATGGRDRTIRLLDSVSGEVCRELHGHTELVAALSFRSDGRLLASAGEDETIRLWEVDSGTCLRILRTPGPYAGMNIGGVTGISEAQKAALKALGAVEE